MSTLAPDAYTEVVAALFKPPMRIICTQFGCDRYSWPVTFLDCTKEAFQNHSTILLLAKTCKEMNNAVKAKFAKYAHEALGFFMTRTIWSSQVKPICCLMI